MAKRIVGLPEGFDLNIAEGSVRDEPVRIGDFLDDFPVAARPAAPRPERRDPPPRGGDEPRSRGPAALPARGEEPGGEKEPPRAARPRKVKPRRDPTQKAKEVAAPKKPPRKQINMTPETLDMVEDLLRYIQMYSRQSDTKASEMFHAIVLAAFQAKKHLDLSDVPRRGQWGSTTAKNFPVALSQAFTRAIAHAFREKRELDP